MPRQIPPGESEVGGGVVGGVVDPGSPPLLPPHDARLKSTE